MQSRSRAVDIALVAVFAALMAVASLLPPLFSVGAVPFAIQLVIILLAPMVLGPWQGTAAVALYVLVGALGLPVYAGGRSGPAVLLGPTGGYLFGYILAALVVGLVATPAVRAGVRSPRGWLLLLLAVVLGVAAIHLGGWAGLVGFAKLAPGAALMTTLAFVPFDLAKGVLAVLLTGAVLVAFPRLASQRR